MERIASFSMDHTTLQKGLYVSRTDGDVVTYDVRMKRPNKGDYLSNGALHTIEHLFATYVRNSKFGPHIIYVGPMGCRTGNYFLTRDTISRQEVLDLVRDAFTYLAGYEGEIPGAKEAECGNYLEHDLAAMKKEAAEYAAVLKDWTVEKMEYEA